MRISDWSSDVCSSDLKLIDRFPIVVTLGAALLGWIAGGMFITDVVVADQIGVPSTTVKLTAEAIGAIIVVIAGKWIASRKTVTKENAHGRSEEHTSELQSLMRISYAVFCLKKT